MSLRALSSVRAPNPAHCNGIPFYCERFGQLIRCATRRKIPFFGFNVTPPLTPLTPLHLLLGTLYDSPVLDIYFKWWSASKRRGQNWNLKCTLTSWVDELVRPVDFLIVNLMKNGYRSLLCALQEEATPEIRSKLIAELTIKVSKWNWQASVRLYRWHSRDYPSGITTAKMVD